MGPTVLLVVVVAVRAGVEWIMVKRYYRQDETLGIILVYMHVTRELTLARLKALEPRVFKLGVAVTATVLEPSTASSAAAAFSGFSECTTLRTCARRGGG